MFIGAGSAISSLYLHGETLFVSAFENIVHGWDLIRETETLFHGH